MGQEQHVLDDAVFDFPEHQQRRAQPPQPLRPARLYVHRFARSVPRHDPRVRELDPRRPGADAAGHRAAGRGPGTRAGRPARVARDGDRQGVRADSPGVPRRSGEAIYQRPVRAVLSGFEGLRAASRGVRAAAGRRRPRRARPVVTVDDRLSGAPRPSR